MTTATDNQISQLRRAQDLLRERGWCKGAYAMGNKICANTALWGGEPQAFFDEAEPLRQQVIQDMPMPHRPCMSSVDRICVFNNEEAATVEDVIAQFQITIDRLERERAPREDRELVAV